MFTLIAGIKNTLMRMYLMRHRVSYLIITTKK